MYAQLYLLGFRALIVPQPFSSFSSLAGHSSSIYKNFNTWTQTLPPVLDYFRRSTHYWIFSEALWCANKRIVNVINFDCAIYENFTNKSGGTSRRIVIHICEESFPRHKQWINLSRHFWSHTLILINLDRFFCSVQFYNLLLVHSLKSVYHNLRSLSGISE